MVLRYRTLPLLLALGTLLVGASSADAQRRGDRGRFDIDDAEVTFSGRVQTQFNTSSVDEVPSTEFLLRRVRIGVDLELNETVSGRIHPEFSGDDIELADAYMQLSVSPGLEFVAGKAYRPFAIMEQTSSLRIIPVERGLSIRGVDDQELSAILGDLGYSARDIGFQVRGSPRSMPLNASYAFGVFAGPLHNEVGSNSSQQYVGRVSIEPISDISIGAAWSRIDFAVEPVPGEFDIEAGDAFVADLVYGERVPEPGPYLVLEGVIGDYNPHADVDFTGGQAWASYRAAVRDEVSIVEPLVRVSYAEIDPSGVVAPEGGLLVTPGINVYFGGLNRIMLNYDIWRPDEGEGEESFKAQFQMAF